MDLGAAIDQVYYMLSNGAAPKKLVDVQAYEFLVGFFTGANLTSALNEQNLYNSIDNRGAIILSLIANVMKAYHREGDVSLSVWQAAHKISTLFQLGSSMLLKMGAVGTKE